MFTFIEPDFRPDFGLVIPTMAGAIRPFFPSSARSLQDIYKLKKKLEPQNWFLGVFLIRKNIIEASYFESFSFRTITRRKLRGLLNRSSPACRNPGSLRSLASGTEMRKTMLGRKGFLNCRGFKKSTFFRRRRLLLPSNFCLALATSRAKKRKLTSTRRRKDKQESIFEENWF